MSSSTVEDNSSPHPMGKLLPIHTKRLILRAATEEDVPNCLSRALDSECVKYLPPLNHKNHTAESCRKWIQHMAKVRHRGKGLWVIVERKEDGRAIGDGGMEDVFWEDPEGKRHQEYADGLGLTRVGECGLMLASGPDVRGRVYADEAMKGIFQMAFAAGEDGRGMGVDEARACTLSRNPGFVKLGRRLRMKETERTRSDGERETWFQLTRQEYDEGRKKGMWDVNDTGRE